MLQTNNEKTLLVFIILGQTLFYHEWHWLHKGWANDTRQVGFMFQWRLNPAHTIWIWQQNSFYQALVPPPLSPLRGAGVNCSCGCLTLTGAAPAPYSPAVAHLCLQVESGQTFHLLVRFSTCLNQSDHWPLTSGINKPFLSRLAHSTVLKPIGRRDFRESHQLH